jgi:hypothetical protein
MLLSGCDLWILKPPKNLYPEKTAVPDPTADYVGVWTSTEPMGLVSMRIDGNGVVRFCHGISSWRNPLAGKVYKEEGYIWIVLEAGMILQLLGVSEEELDFFYYGGGLEYGYYQGETGEMKFHSGRVPEEYKDCIK